MSNPSGAKTPPGYWPEFQRLMRDSILVVQKLAVDTKMCEKAIQHSDLDEVKRPAHFADILSHLIELNSAIQPPMRDFCERYSWAKGGDESHNDPYLKSAIHNLALCHNELGCLTISIYVWHQILKEHGNSLDLPVGMDGWVALRDSLSASQLRAHQLLVWMAGISSCMNSWLEFQAYVDSHRSQ